MSYAALGAEDAAWLHMEAATNPMVVEVLLELATAIDIDLVHALMERVTKDFRFRSVIVEPMIHLGRPHWEPHAGFDLERHIELVRLSDSSDEALRVFVGRAVSSQLPADRPSWRLFVIEREGKGSALLFRVHHAIADGFGLLRLLLSSALGRQPVDVNQPHPVKRARGARGYASSLARLVTLPPDPSTTLKAPLQAEKHVAWSRPMRLADLKRIGVRAGGTVNDVMIALLTGALRRWLERDAVNVEGIEVRAMIPVNLRRAEDALDLGNHFGLVVLGLPIAIIDPVARIAAVRDRTRSLKGSREAIVAKTLLGAMGRAPRFVEDAGVAFFAKKVSVVFTNVPGPRRTIDLSGVPVTRLVFWVPQASTLGLGISVFSYAGNVTIGFLADSGAIADPTVLVKDLEDELASVECELEQDARAPSEVLAEEMKRSLR